MQKYAYTRLSAAYLLTLLQEDYSVLKMATCHYFTAGLHDNYIVETSCARFICRVYRNDWRSEDEIGYELELLAYLSEQDSPVAAPVPDRKSYLFFRINCPEGMRLVALFNYAVGNPPRSDIGAETALLLGQAVARVHQDGAGFQSGYQRKALKLPFLLTDALDAIFPFLCTEDADYLQRVAHKLERKLQPIEDSLPQVVCQGDVNPGNFHITAEHQITLFDFDQCGVGARVFEIAKFQAAIHRLPNKQAIADAFIEGYQRIAPVLSSLEREALPDYEAVAAIWVMANRPWNAEWIGYQLLQDDFWQQRLSVLRGMDIVN